MTPQEELLKKTRQTLDSISPSFCIAKWTQSTLHLHRGLTHSCHHPKAHKIPLSELDQDIFSLHNTNEKIVARSQMLKGIRPEECSYCWNIEDLGSEQVSDRILKSKDPWAMPFLEEIRANPLTKKVLPRYLEVSFSRTCNFSCIYCSPSFSSRWAQEIKKWGPYDSRAYEQQPHHLDDAFEEENNPYIEAFWKWWPNIKSKLHTFRITGGEPLLSENTFRVFQELTNAPEKNLEFSINSNLGVSADRFQRFQSNLRSLVEAKGVKKFQIYTSLEAMGPQAEFIRTGLNESKFWENLEHYLSIDRELSVTIMVTYNLFSVPSFSSFLEKVLVLRKKYSSGTEPARLKLDISYLRHPYFLAPNLLPAMYHTVVEEQLSFMEANVASSPNNSQGFYNFELVKMRRLVEWIKKGLPQEESKKLNEDLRSFLNQLEERRGLKANATFPSFSGWLS